jgi:hypothetical protein
VIDDATLDAIAELGTFRIDYDLSALRETRAAWTGTDILWGTGVHDIDHVIELMILYPHGLFKLDTGVDGKDSSWDDVTPDDMTRYREFFVQRWGEVNKVSVWVDE